MDPVWLLKGSYDAPGWKTLEADSKADQVDLLMYDRREWALLRAPEPPTKYEGMTAGEPPTGMYLDDQGRGLYIVDAAVVPGPRQVIEALGDEAEALLATLRDEHAVLDRLGRVF